MACYVLDFEDIDQTQVAVGGGKGAHLGELSRIEDVRVPAGFCVTTHAFQRIMSEAPSIDGQLDRLSRLKPDDRDAICALSAEIRRTLEAIVIPDDLGAAITRSLARLGEQAAYAVRSSATAEDLPTASFAGQHDTYLNVVGPAAVLQHVSRCWASLFTERAVIYRLRNGLDHRKVHMGVVVQKMVFPQAAGILFTADPVTGNRKVASVEASFGLGEALVSGLVNADVYKVRDSEIVARAVGAKQLAIHASPAGGTQQQEIEPEHADAIDPAIAVSSRDFHPDEAGFLQDFLTEAFERVRSHLEQAFQEPVLPRNFQCGISRHHLFDGERAPLRLLRPVARLALASLLRRPLLSRRDRDVGSRQREIERRRPSIFLVGLPD